MSAFMRLSTKTGQGLTEFVLNMDHVLQVFPHNQHNAIIHLASGSVTVEESYEDIANALEAYPPGPLVEFQNDDEDED